MDRKVLTGMKRIGEVKYSMTKTMDFCDCGIRVPVDKEIGDPIPPRAEQ